MSVDELWAGRYSTCTTTIRNRPTVNRRLHGDGMTRTAEIGVGRDGSSRSDTAAEWRGNAGGRAEICTRRRDDTSCTATAAKRTERTGAHRTRRGPRRPAGRPPGSRARTRDPVLINAAAEPCVGYRYTYVYTNITAYRVPGTSV